jgi:hypothetical protein
MVKRELTELDRKTCLDVETILCVLGFENDDGVKEDFN